MNSGGEDNVTVSEILFGKRFHHGENVKKRTMIILSLQGAKKIVWGAGGGILVAGPITTRRTLAFPLVLVPPLFASRLGVVDASAPLYSF